MRAFIHDAAYVAAIVLLPRLGNDTRKIYALIIRGKCCFRGMRAGNVGEEEGPSARRVCM